MKGSDAGMADSSSDLAAELLIVSEVLGQCKDFFVMLLMRGQAYFKGCYVHDILPQSFLFIAK